MILFDYEVYFLWVIICLFYLFLFLKKIGKGNFENFNKVKFFLVRGRFEKEI